MTEGILRSTMALSEHRATLIEKYQTLSKTDNELIASLKEIIRLKDEIIAIQERHIKRLEGVLKL